MSKKVHAKIVCPSCGLQFDFTLYRSIWGEYPENRELVMSDQINIATCPSCKIPSKLQYPFLYTNVKENFAIWWEPYFDNQIDKDSEVYKDMMGEGNYLATAPRIQDWDEFKQTIIKYEEGILKGQPGRPSGEMFGQMQGYLQHMRSENKKRNKGCLGSLFLVFIFFAMLLNKVM